MTRITSCRVKYDKHGILPFLCALLIFFYSTSFIGVCAYAASYYVAKNGSDENNGNETQPWLTIQHAANQASAGDTVFVKAGKYNERITLTNSGHASQGYITLRNHPGDKPIIDGTGLGLGTMIYGAGISYIKIIGFHITNHIGAGIRFFGDGVDFSHIEIRDNEISNQTYQSPPSHCILVAPVTWPGPVFTSATDIIVDGNYIHDVDTGIPTAFNETLTLAWDIKRFQITNNIIDNSPYIGTDLIGKITFYGKAAGHPHEGIISGNTINNVGYSAPYGGGVALYLDGAKNVVIEQNKVSNCAAFGIVVSTEDPNFTTSDVIVRRNEVWNTGIGIAPMTGHHGISVRIRTVHNTMYADIGGKKNIGLYKGSDVLIKNNIASNLAENYNLVHSREVSSPTLDYNCYYPSNSYFQYLAEGPVYLNFSSYQAATAQDAHGFAQNPLFVDTASRDFHLQSNSPCIDAGDYLTTTTGSGSGTSIPVNDALYFSDGYGVADGDLVKIGSNNPAKITSINYGTNTITVDRAISWQAGDGVSYPYYGSAPDIGAYEYGSSPPSPPRNLKIIGTAR